MLHDMCLNCSLHLLTVCHILKRLRHLGIVKQIDMDRHVRHMILEDKRFSFAAFHKTHVLRYRVGRLGFFTLRNQLINIFNAHRLQHLPVQIWQVIYLWVLLRHLYRCLILHNPLCHRCRIGVTYRTNLDVAVIFFAAVGFIICADNVVTFITRLTNNIRKQLQLCIERMIHTALHRTHHFK